METFADLLGEYNETRRPQDRANFCNAPFVSLNFEQTGKVTACCYNRSFVLGNYPQNTIGEIWNSEKTKELRESIKGLDLEKGCQICKDTFVSKNFHTMLTRNFDMLKGGVGEPLISPRILEFEISNLCNLECVMCNGHFSSAIRKNRERLAPLDSPYNEDFVRQLKPLWATVETAKFLGGEPFLNPLYFKMWEDITESGAPVDVVITTNGTILNQRVIGVLNNIKPTLVLSIDSLRKSTYELIRQNASFEITMENMKAFLTYGRFDNKVVVLAVCPMIHNYEEIPDIFAWGNENCVEIFLNNVIYPTDLSLKSLPKEKLIEIGSRYRSAMPVASKFKSIAEGNGKRFQSLIQQIEAWSRL